VSEDAKASELDEFEDGTPVGDVAGAAGSSTVDWPTGDPAASPASGIDIEARAEADPRTRVELIADLDGVEAQRDEYLDDLRRSHADLENYRKRVARDGALQRGLGRSDVVTALLDVLDDLDRVVAAAGALDAASLDQDTAAVTSGVQVVAEKARRALEGLGVERLDAAGVPFDPTVHDAVQQVEAHDVSQPTVHQVLRPGYRLPDRVLRPAMVIVAQ
jgi:molecular chaperone GrpE